MGLPSKIMSPLCKLKIKMYLTDERKYHCGILISNRIKKCLKVDFLGHFTQATMLFQFHDIENRHIKANTNSSASFDINYLNSAKIPKYLLPHRHGICNSTNNTARKEKNQNTKLT